jgi:hypothetical protein
MKIRTIVLAAASLGLGPATCMLPQASAQPLWDVVHVSLPYTVTVGHKTLSPGDYTIQQLHSADNSPVLLIYGNNGMKFETSAMTIKALDLNTPEDTSVILHHVGDDYYFDKIWIQGKNYGYEFPLPSRLKSREKEMAAVNVKASATTTNTATEPTSTPDTDADRDDAVAAPTTQPAINTNTADTTPVPPPTPVTDQNTTPPPVPEPQATTPIADNSQTAAPVPAPSSETSANRERRPDTDNTDSSPSMPSTSAGWLAMLLSGGTLSGAGMMLRRRR